MPANTSPIFTLTPKAATANIAAANTARDGSGTLVTLFTAGTNGSRVDFITFTSSQVTAAASAARVHRVFLTDESGLNPRLISEVLLSAVTASNTAIGATATITFTNGLIINAGQIIRVSQSVYGSAADATDVLLRGGNF
jgi:thiamine pyrophosphokinase